MEVMTIDSLNGLRGVANAYAVPANLAASNIASPLTREQAQALLVGILEQAERYDTTLLAAVGSAPQALVNASVSLRNEVRLPALAALDEVDLLPAGSTLDQTTVRRVQDAALVLARVAQGFASLERQYTKTSSGNVIGVVLAAVGVAGLFWWLKQKKSTARSRKALGCASCGSKRR